MRLTQTNQALLKKSVPHRMLLILGLVGVCTNFNISTISKTSTSHNIIAIKQDLSECHRYNGLLWIK